MENTPATNAVALVLAGGTGTRMGRPKQFIELLGKPALLHSLLAFEASPAVGRIYTVGDAGRIGELARREGIGKYAGCAPPGASRSLSTLNGLGLCGEDDDAVVLVHDGSRCLVTPDLIGRVADAAREPDADGAIPALPVWDTIKVAENGHVKETLDRNLLRSVQTPQAFRLGTLRRVFAAAEDLLHAATDDAYLIEREGGRVVTVPGEKTNIKLTAPEDLILAEAILASRGGRP